jgi:hypothetical protein
MNQEIHFEIGNQVYICQDVSNINDDLFILMMNAYMVSGGKYGHNLAVRGGINSINALKPERYLTELSVSKIREFLVTIESNHHVHSNHHVSGYNEDTESDNELYTKHPYTEKVIIDGETIIYQN